MGFEAFSGRMGPSIYMICGFLAFFFATVATPIAQFQGRGVQENGEDAVPKASCVTLWGAKKDCRRAAYVARVDEFVCSDNSSSVSRVFQAAEAFAIISIIVTLASCIANILYLSGRSGRALTVMLAVLGVVVTIIPWSCMASVWHGSTCGAETGAVWRSQFKYGLGFGMFVAAWCLQVVGTASLIMLRH